MLSHISGVPPEVPLIHLVYRLLPASTNVILTREPAWRGGASAPGGRVQSGAERVPAPRCAPTPRPTEPGAPRASRRSSGGRGSWVAGLAGYGSVGGDRGLGAEPAARPLALAGCRLPTDPAAAARAGRPASGLRVLPGPDPLWENQGRGTAAPGRLPGL